MPKLSPADRAAIFGTRTRDNPEDRFQMDLVEHLRLRARKGVVFYMIPNHAMRTKNSKAKAGRAKAMGFRRGAADLGFVIPPHGQAAFLELKYGANTASDTQEQFGEDVMTAGAWYATAWDIDTAIGILTAWQVIR